MPRDKICGDLLGTDAVAQLRAIGFAQHVTAAAHGLDGAVLHGPAGERFGEARQECARDVAVLPRALVVRRRTFDTALLEEARAASASLRFEAVLDIVRDATGRIVGVRTTVGVRFRPLRRRVCSLWATRRHSQARSAARGSRALSRVALPPPVFARRALDGDEGAWRIPGVGEAPRAAFENRSVRACSLRYARGLCANLAADATSRRRRAIVARAARARLSRAARTRTTRERAILFRYEPFAACLMAWHKK